MTNYDTSRLNICSLSQYTEISGTSSAFLEELLLKIGDRTVSAFYFQN